MKKIDISIIMGIYNCEDYLQESIESIINQTFENWELIMCDDGSRDNTYLIAKKYEEKYPDKIKLLKNEHNLGLNETLNKCLKVANGKYIARQDADDVSLSNRLEIEYNFLENNTQYALVSSAMIFFDENGEWGILNSVKEPNNLDFVDGSPFAHAAAMIRTKVLKEVGGYTVNKKLIRVEDYHLWFKIYSRGYKGYNLQEAYYKMRDDNSAYKRRNWNNRKNEMYVRFIGYKMLGIPISKYIFCFKPLVVYFLPKKLYNYCHKRYKGRCKK